MKTNASFKYRVRGDCMIRALKMVRLFETGKAFTRNRVAWELGVSREAAARWVDAMSVVYRVREAGFEEAQGKGRRARLFMMERAR